MSNCILPRAARDPSLASDAVVYTRCVGNGLSLASRWNQISWRSLNQILVNPCVAAEIQHGRCVRNACTLSGYPLEKRCLSKSPSAFRIDLVAIVHMDALLCVLIAEFWPRSDIRSAERHRRHPSGRHF